jgi:DNA polymerase I-like protein with 3'-5' exonuclease and polymerase domains
MDEEGEALSTNTINLFTEASQGIDTSCVFVSQDPFYASKNKGDLTMTEIRKERPRVLSEIQAASPDLVICCGPIATACVFGKGNMAEERMLRRRWYPFGENTTPVFVTFTPERARYTHDMKRIILNDIRWAVYHVDPTIPERTQPSYQLIAPEDPEWRSRPANARCDPHAVRVIGFDLETYPSISPYDEDARIRMAVLSYPGGHGRINTFVIQCKPNSEFPDWVSDDLSSRAILKSGSNIKFDVRWCRRFGVFVRNYEDTNLREAILDSSSPRKDLKFLAFSYAPELGAYNQPLEELLDSRGGEFKNLTDAEMYDYAACDGVTSLKAYWGQAERDVNGLLSTKGAVMLRRLYTLLCDLEYNGIGVDLDRLDMLAENYQAELVRLRTEITRHLGPINIDSPTSLANALSSQVKNINLKPRDWRRLLSQSSEETELVSTAKEVLSREAWRHPAIPLIMQYRQTSVRYNTFVKAMREKHLQVVDRIPSVYPSYNIGTETYRLTSSNPNGMNLPREREEGGENLSIKSQFLGRYGSNLLEIDLSQIEIRVAAALSGDAAMCEALMQGGDIHTQMAARMLGKAAEYVTKEERQACKTRTFLILYGGGAQKLAADLKIDKQSAQQMIDEYFNTFSGLKAYIEEVRAEIKENGYVTTPFGLRRYFVKPVKWNSRDGSSVLRQGFNTKIQHTAVMIMYYLMIEMANELGSLDAALVQQVHDSITLEVGSGMGINAVLQRMTSLCQTDSLWNRLEDDWGMTGVRVRVPITFEATVGQRLGVSRIPAVYTAEQPRPRFGDLIGGTMRTMIRQTEDDMIWRMTDSDGNV